MGKIIVRALFVQFLVVGAWAQSQSLDCRFDGDDELSFQLNVNPGQGGGELTLWRYLSFAKEDQLKSNELKNCTVQRVGLEKQEIVVSCLLQEPLYRDHIVLVQPGFQINFYFNEDGEGFIGRDAYAIQFDLPGVFNAVSASILSSTLVCDNAAI
ncbi:MAG: hypothetical protein H6626_06435 [Pseudobdellovibrionaceae bacterium]|nr:hypothetical protein [Bdellovibrionales bacterium]USN48723.1 MAG: hypothetical protein H6626_06435 [Pseudobdellovibrionaceae bacterium]